MEVVHGIGSFHFMQTVGTISLNNMSCKYSDANALTCCWIIILFLLGGTKAIIFIIIIRLVLSVAWVWAVIQLILLPVLGPSVLGVPLQLLIFLIPLLLNPLGLQLFQSFLDND